jgi:hypothetical protein
VNRPFKALSIRQPWSWLICRGYKDIENRGWKIGSQQPPRFSAMVGDIVLPCRVYIHASMSKSDMNEEVILWIKQRLNRIQRVIMANTLLNPGLYHGGIIGEVTITDCVTESKSPWFVGKYGFVLSDPVLYDKPIPCRGQLGFFKPEITHWL